MTVLFLLKGYNDLLLSLDSYNFGILFFVRSFFNKATYFHGILVQLIPFFFFFFFSRVFILQILIGFIPNDFPSKLFLFQFIRLTFSLSNQDSHDSSGFSLFVLFFVGDNCYSYSVGFFLCIFHFFFFQLKLFCFYVACFLSAFNHTEIT